MLTFSQFIEVVDAAPAKITWDDSCVFSPTIKDTLGKGERQSRAMHLSRLNTFNRINSHTGCFTINGEKFVVKVDISSASDNRTLLSAKNNFDLSQYVSNNSVVADVEFSRIKDNVSYVGIDRPWGTKLTSSVGQVFSTVLDGVRFILTKHPVDIILFESWASTRTRFYKSMVSRFGMGYKLVNFENFNSDRDAEGNYKVKSTLFMLVKEKLGDLNRYGPRKLGITNDRL
jgi:hypothetical protein